MGKKTVGGAKMAENQIKVSNFTEFVAAFGSLADGGSIVLTAPVDAEAVVLHAHSGRITVSSEK